ncbi:hypothetical protein NPIL_64451 [Nephila pilipes]|uniref:Uncharacterized protein n=1 Tax=Nephila pilipes TaxID=299642 RepID=A0A8X6NAV9_NEPPI|nr:hypothetical protein NPIL_64451 [Nephila pilipes]
MNWNLSGSSVHLKVLRIDNRREEFSWKAASDKDYLERPGVLSLSFYSKTMSVELLTDGSPNETLNRERNSRATANQRRNDRKKNKLPSLKTRSAEIVADEIRTRGDQATRKRTRGFGGREGNSRDCSLTHFHQVLTLFCPYRGGGRVKVVDRKGGFVPIPSTLLGLSHRPDFSLIHHSDPARSVPAYEASNPRCLTGKAGFSHRPENQERYIPGGGGGINILSPLRITRMRGEGAD